MVWGRFSKPVISLAIEMGFDCAICQTKGNFFSLSPTTKKDMMRYRFLKISIKILFFHSYFLNQDFLFTNQISTSRLCNLINNVFFGGNRISDF